MAFIVIEGLDGAGKSTQIDLLQEYIIKKNILFKYVHFPRTDTDTIYGHLIARFLRGEFGGNKQVDPYLVALLYAGDRKDASEELQKAIGQGALLLMDRYVYSNIGYQCAKVVDEEKRKTLKEWILHLEYTYNKIPRPDINFFLDVPFSFTKNKLESRREGQNRQYLKGGEDIHEKDLDFQCRVRQVYLDMAKEVKDIRIVNCTKNNKMLSPEDIHNQIIKELHEQGIL